MRKLIKNLKKIKKLDWQWNVGGKIIHTVGPTLKLTEDMIDKEIRPVKAIISGSCWTGKPLPKKLVNKFMINKQRHIKSLTNLNNRKSGVERIKMEREWQIADSMVDDRIYTEGEIARNAIYCVMQYMKIGDGNLGVSHNKNWNLHIKFCDNPVRLLTVAGALIAAELDRLLPARKIPDPNKRKKK